MSEPPSTPSRTWRLVAPAQRDGGKRARRLRVALTTATVLALSGALIAWLTFIRVAPRASFLPLCIDEYGDDFPVRPWVRQDAETLRGLNWEEENAFTTQKRGLLSQELRAFAARKSAGPLVVYLNALALATPKGELCVLAVDASLDRPDTWLPLREVFDRLRESKARHKLLLLDIMQPFADARRGVLRNDAAERLQPLLDEMLPKDPRLSVLCACSPGQTSVVAEELGHSVFAYFLWEGLRGQADRENARRTSDGSISLQELAKYVTTQVEQWTVRQRNVRQTPRLHGAKGDYPLAAVSAAPAGTPVDADYPEWLRDGWQRRDRWWDEEGYRRMPDTLRQLEAVLLRAEQQWRGGIEVKRVIQELTRRCERLEQQRNERLPFARAGTVDSLAQATTCGRKLPERADKESVLAVEELAVRQARAKAGKPDEAKSKELADDREKLLKKFAGQPLALAWVVFETAVSAEAPLTPAFLRFLADLLAQARMPVYAETRLLLRLAELPANPPDAWPAEGIALALRTIQQAEKIAAGDPQALRCVSEMRNDADSLHQEGQALLCSPSAAERGRAAERLRLALQTYQAIQEDLYAVEAAQSLSDQMRVRLPSYEPYLEIDGAPEQAWTNALATSRALRQVLTAVVALRGPGRDAQIRQMIALTATLRNDANNLNSLRRPLDRTALDELIGRRRGGDYADVQVMTALLATPWPRADDRVRLWAARNEALAVLRRRSAMPNVPAWNERRALDAERQRALRRARRSLEMLKWEGVDQDQIEKGEQIYARAAEKPSESVLLQALAVELHHSVAPPRQQALKEWRAGTIVPRSTECNRH